MAYSLTYSYNSSSQSYSVTGYSGITASDKVVIPAMYDDRTHGIYPVTSIGSEAFSSCSSLTNITIPNSIVNIGGYAFAGCNRLISIAIPDSVTTIGGGLFTSCSSLTSVTIGNGVTSIDMSAFANCSSLTSITIPDSVTSIGSDAFFGCSSLTQLILLPSSPPDLGSGAIPNNVQSIYVQQSSKAAYKAAANWAAFASKIISDDMYLSLAQFNQKNKEYIDNRDSLLANSLMGSGVQGGGNPPLQGYNKDKGTIENRFNTAEQTTNKFHSSYQNDFSSVSPTNEIHIPLRSINNADVYTFFFVMIAIYDNSNSKFLNCCMTIGNGESATGYFIIKEAFSNNSIKTVSCTYSNGVYILTGPSDKVSGKSKYELLKAAVLRIN